MANRKYFGTDGVRGKVGTYPITPDFALKLGWAAGKVLASQGSRTVSYTHLDVYKRQFLRLFYLTGKFNIKTF